MRGFARAASGKQSGNARRRGANATATANCGFSSADPADDARDDGVYDLSYARAPHPSYGDAPIPAWT